MPYIGKEQRAVINKFLDGLIVILVNRTNSGKINSGEVVYTIYKILKEIYGGGNFERRSNALRVLEAAKLEYYRKVIVEYEEKKLQEHGDV